MEPDRSAQWPVAAGSYSGHQSKRLFRHEAVDLIAQAHLDTAGPEPVDRDVDYALVRGAPEVIRAMDSGDLSISAEASIASTHHYATKICGLAVEITAD
jgi:hypothetical protein